MERPIAKLGVQNAAVALRTKPYEIKTIKVEYPMAQEAAQP
jgi:hypothetical protein